MATIKYKNPNYIEGGSEPKYVTVPQLTVKNNEIHIGTDEPVGEVKLWINPETNSIKFDNDGEWVDLMI